MVVPLFVEGKVYQSTSRVKKLDKSIVLVTQKTSEVDEPNGKDLYQFGCLKFFNFKTSRWNC